MIVTGLEENVPLIVCGRIFLAKRGKKKKNLLGECLLLLMTNLGKNTYQIFVVSIL
jgi:hypothetical protein